MSLINEALKKAQRQRSDQPPATNPDGSPAPVEKRAKPMRAQALLLLATGATVLIVFSVVITVYLVNRRPPSLATAAPATVKPVIRVESSDPSPIIVAPLLPASTTASTPVSSPASEAPLSAPIAPVITREPTPTVADSVAPPIAEEKAQESEVQPSAAVRPVASGATTTQTSAAADPRVINFVDAIRVTGIRSSGNESKVLMNDRVFRVNDIVDRTLVLKLVKVESDTLTFIDANGVVYTKNF